MENISLDQTQDQGLTIFPETANEQVYNSDYAATKADKLGLTLGAANPGVDVLTSDVSAGLGEKWAHVLKNQADTDNMIMRNDLLQQVARGRQANTPLSTDEVNLIANLSNDELHAADLGTILEKKYADLYQNTLVTNEEAHIAQEAFDEDPDGALDELDRSSFPLQRAQIVQDVYEGMKATYSSQGWVSWGADMAKSIIIPGYDTLKGRERVETDTHSILLGRNKEEQIAYLYSLPPAEFKVQLKDAVDTLAKDNIPMAMDFITSVYSYTSESKSLDNISLGVDVATALPVTKVARLGAGMSKMAKAVTKSPRLIPEIAAEAGFNKTASIGKVTEDIAAGDLSGITTRQRIQDLGYDLPSLMNPTKIAEGSTRQDAEAVNRLKIMFQEQADKVVGFFNEGKLPDRTELSQIQKSVTELQAQVEDRFSSNVQNIIDTAIIPAEKDILTNTPNLVIRFGRRDGSFFKYEATAKNFAERYIGLKTNDFKVVQQPLGGWAVEVTKPITDVGNWRKEVIGTELATPDTFDGKFSRALRSKDYFLSVAQTKARGRVVHTTEHLSQVMDKLTKPFRGKSNEWYSEMDAMYSLSRTNEKYFQNIGEFENAFYKKFSKIPSDDQYEAYFTYQMLGDLDYIVRDADKVKKLTNAGFEQVEFTRLPKEKYAGPPESVKTYGRRVDALPVTDRAYKIQIIQDNKILRNIPSTQRGYSNNQKLIQGLLEDGYKIIQTAEEGNNVGTYLIIKDFKASRIPMRTLGYKEGGHWTPRYSHYVSQGRFEDIDTAKVFTGDLNLATAPTAEQATKIAQLFDEGRLKVKNNAPDAKRWIDEHLPITYEKFIQKVSEGKIDLNTPVIGRRAGTTTADSFKYESIYPNFQDNRYVDYNPLRETTQKFGTERADETLDVWTADNGIVYRQNWDPLLSPMDALSSATRNMINVRVFEDYAMKSANDWVQEFGHLLNAPTEAIRANPRYYMTNAKKYYRSEMVTNKAEASRLAHLSMFDQLDHMDVDRIVARDKVLNTLFNLRTSSKQWDPAKVYSAQDVQSFLRGAAFHMNLGLFNPKQFFQQSSAVAGIVAISPKHGMKAMAVGTPVRLALMNDNPAVLSGLSKKFAKIAGWDEKDFQEMVRSFKASGMSDVGGDTAYLDRMDVRPAVAGALDRYGRPLLKAGATPFAEGERWSRIVAYAASYSEWRALNPGKTLDRFAESTILQRAKNMTTNMTRDSNARWQKGWPSVLTQFWSYQARMAEQMWDGGGIFKDGTKLSKREKWQLMGMMSVLYGGGTAVSMNGVFIPTTQLIRQWMAEQGVKPEDVPGGDLFVNGAPAALTKAILGADMDFNNFGPGGLTTLVDFMNGDKDFAEKLMGAGPGIALSSGSSLWGLGVRLGYYEGGLTADDVLSTFRNVKSVDNVYKTLMAINTGRWVSKSGNYVADVNLQEAIMAGVTGAQPMVVTETFTNNLASKKFEDFKNQGKREYEDAVRKANDAVERGDDESYMIYRKRRDSISILYGLSPADVSAIRNRNMVRRSFSDAVEDRINQLERKYLKQIGED